MSVYLWEIDELKRLNSFAKNRKIEFFDYTPDDDLTIHLVDGGFIRLSTLGGIEIEELKNNHRKKSDEYRPKADFLLHIED